MYANGTGVPEDDTEAVHLYRRAAEQGYAAAQHNLALMYVNGTGVPKNGAEALRWSRQAAEQGYALAQAVLGLMYMTGVDVPENYSEAERWFRQAAEQGLAEAQFALGLMYADGIGVPEDDTEAFRWWRQAAAQGDALAQAKVAWVLLEQGQPDDAIEAAREAVRMDPNLPFVQETLCGIFASLEQIGDGVAACSVALEVDPGNSKNLNALAWMLVTADGPRFHDPQKGLLLAKRAVDASSEQNAAYLDTLGEAYYANGRFEEAIEVERKAIALKPQYEAFQKQLHKFEQALLVETKN
jgi:TPR repeat protein